MYNILTLNKIAKCGLDYLDANYAITEDAAADCDGIILRSFKMHDMELPASLKAVARAGAGVNNIPVDKCAEKGIVVFNTPGANANAVKELVLTALFLASRDVVGGIEWVKSELADKGDQVGALVEKGKSAFVGPEITGKKLGVIGLGAIGILVANAAAALGMEVIGYDPFLSVDAAWRIDSSIKHGKTVAEIFAQCDYVTLHLPYNSETKNMVNKELLDSSKDGIRVLNLARGELVDNEAMIAALESGKVAKYVTDFPSAEVIGVKNVVPMPHLGASTPEAEDNCAVMAVKEIKEFLETGNIVNSVNYPNCSMPRSSETRITIAHKNLPNVISKYTSALGEKGVNIENMVNKSRGDYAYTIIDASGDISGVEELLMAVEETLKVRVIK